LHAAGKPREVYLPVPGVGPFHVNPFILPVVGEDLSATPVYRQVEADIYSGRKRNS